MIKFKKILFLLVVFIFFGIFQNLWSQDADYDLLIDNAQILDGSGAKAFAGRIYIRDGKIAKIEQGFSEAHSAAKRIDASNRLVSPGFIDTHAHGNPGETPNFENFLAMGVTSIFLGQDGYNAGGTDFQVEFQKLKDLKTGPNIGYFLGHNSLRQSSGVNYDSIPSEEGLHRMKSNLEAALKSGAFGMSTGLEYNPGSFSQENELKELAKIVGKHEGILMSHMRNEDDSEVENSIRELLAQGQYCPVHISHIKSVYGKGESRAEEILNLLDSARNNGITVTADLYPYNASYTGITIVFPDWAKKPYNYEQVVVNRRAELAEFLRNRIAKRNGPEATLIGSGKFAGKNLKQIASELNKSFEDVLIDDISPYGAGGAYFIMDEALQSRLLQHEAVNICSDGSPSMRHPRGYGSFSKVLEDYVYGQNLLSLEEAVFKMTGLPAKTLGLKNRGLLKEGYQADLLIFNPKNVKANATYEKPHLLAEGIDLVLVNGKIAKEDGKFSEELNGRILLKVQ